MKLWKKLVTVALAAATIAVACVAFTACGEAKISGVYLSPAQLSYQNMRPQYNYYLTTFAQQEITLYGDNTYCLIVSSSTFSALELSEETQDAKGNERTNSIYKYYGTYTSAANAIDDELLDVTLATPTRVVLSFDSTYYLDTASWTDEMGLTVVPGKVDSTTGQTTKDPDAKPWTADEYLATVAFDETKVTLDTGKYTFDFTDFTVTKKS